MQSADVTATWCATAIDEWCCLGATDAVIAPGSRSTPMALAVAAESRLRLHVFHDERSAAFAALGIAQATGRPALLLCTSGTAAVNFHPAVVEASHAEVPMIVLTADRPPELQGVGAPQTIDQQRLFGAAVRQFIDAGVPDDDRRNEWRNVAGRAWRAANLDRPGPVQVNLPFREPLVGAPRDLPPRETRSAGGRSSFSATGRVSTKQLPTEMLSKLATRLVSRRGVIVAGAGAPHAEPLMKVVNTWLRDCEAELVVVGASSFLIDPDRRCAMHVVAAPDTVCNDLVSVVRGRPAPDHWRDAWVGIERTTRETIAGMLDDEQSLSEPGTARMVAESLARGSSLVVSSSMPVRDLEWYAGACDHLQVFSNRGANGIDGVVSTAVGVALASQAPTALLIGDVAFLHDANGLVALRHRTADLRIVVVDNDGGGIFSFLPQRSTLPNERFEQLFGTPHGTDLETLARAHGLQVECVSSSGELRNALAQTGPRVIVVRTNRDENVRLHDALHAAVAQALTTAAR